MKRLIALALTVFALAAVPVAFGDDGTPPADGSTPPAASQDHAQRGRRAELLKARITIAELRFAKRCGAKAADAPQRCLAFANKVEERLTKLDTNIQARVAKIQGTCSTTSTDAKCKNAAARVTLLQNIDARVQSLAQKVQDWLDGKTVSGSSSSDGESSLDQAAAKLGQLTQQVGSSG